MSIERPSDRPALGHFLAQPAVQARRAANRTAMERSLDDHQARYRLMVRLGHLELSVQNGCDWRWIAARLRSLADVAERVPARLLERDMERAA